ncbi:excinuclease ABC subunit C [Enterococcus faecalis]|uniref:excinuclease ABC subunit C n=1 Tax=Enterococcus faecalis TaxID=1351 RepID=UPI00398BC193
MENFMKKFDYQGVLIKKYDKTTNIAYIQCTCGCLASRVSSHSDKYKCSWCKRVCALRKEIRTTKQINEGFTTA